MVCPFQCKIIVAWQNTSRYCDCCNKMQKDKNRLYVPKQKRNITKNFNQPGISDAINSFINSNLKHQALNAYSENEYLE